MLDSLNVVVDDPKWEHFFLWALSNAMERYAWCADIEQRELVKVSGAMADKAWTRVLEHRAESEGQ